MSAPAAPVERLDVDVGDGLQLHVARCGAGTPLLLLHGFTGSGETWMPLREPLGAGRTLLMVDLPGHGRSSVPADPPRCALPRLADDLALLLDRLGHERVAVLGYSLGGRAALHFALRHSGRVSALVLESASPGITDPAERLARVRADEALADEIERNGVESFVERWERLPLWASHASLPPAVRAAQRALRLRNRAEGLACSLRGAGAGAEPPVLDRLHALDVPALLVAGALDAKYVALGRELERALPHARLAVVPEAGHAVHLERPTAFAAEVTAFLDAVPLR